jgi:hypothetical protein
MSLPQGYVMQKLSCSWILLGVVLAVPPAAHADTYSVRDLGFVETVARPFRLLIVHDDPTALQAEQQRLSLQKMLGSSNVVVARVSLEQRKKYPGLEQAPLPRKLTRPVFFLLAPDDRLASIDTPDVPIELVQSPLRHAVLSEVPRALCAVVLLESTDAAANDGAKAKAETVLRQINKVRKKLAQAPSGAVKLLTLPAAMREQERWMLWSLGEEITAGNVPKMVVIFGNLRRAGPLFEGVDWKEADLFARIAMLGQSYQDELDCRQYFGPSLLFRETSEWQKNVAAGLKFNPRDAAVKDEVVALLSKPAPPRKIQPPTFNDLVAGLKEQEHDEEIAPPPQAKIAEIPKNEEEEGPNGNQVIEPPAEVSRMEAALPPMANLIILAAGVVGWILLGISYWIIESRPS